MNLTVPDKSHKISRTKCSQKFLPILPHISEAKVDPLSEKLKGNGWLEALFGLEKENIRVDKFGNMALTPHPVIFGNKRKHAYITTDFSESQVEMITPPLPDIVQTLGFLDVLHDIVSLELKEEYLWPQSLPPVLPEDQKIPIAQFDKEGQEAQEYREFLAKKYGPKNQLFSGIHFNISFGNKLLQTLYHQSNSSLSFEDYCDTLYLKTARQLIRLRWLYVLLFGNSPVVDSTMELKCKKSPFQIHQQVIGLSIRNSCFGYRNIGDIYPEYTTVERLKDSISQMIAEGKLASPKELYAPVRLKFLNHPDHISHMEIRFIDIDPMEKNGINKEALYFIHALTLYGLLTGETDDFDAKAQINADDYHGYISLYGLHEGNSQNGEFRAIWQDAYNTVEAMRNLFSNMEITHKDFNKSIDYVTELIKNPESRKVNKVLEGVLKMGYIPFHMQKAVEYLEESRKRTYIFSGFEDLELSTQLLLREAVKRGVKFDILDRKENFIRLKQNDHIEYVKQATKTALDNYASILAMENKMVTKKILAEAGIRVPQGYEYTDVTVAQADFAVFKGKAIVVKPNQTNFGIGITIIRKNDDESVFKRAVEIAFKSDGTILIEEFIEGREFRIFVIDHEVAGILHRVPANITGDGLRTIRELVQIKNQDPLRGKGYRTPLEKIALGEAEDIFLKAQQKNFDTIPAKDETVYLRENSNISTGGDSIDFTDEIPESYKQLAVKAAEALHVRITGLDMIISDIKKEADAENYAIIEMNFNPAIHIHCHPYKGKNRRLNEKIMDALGFRTA